MVVGTLNNVNGESLNNFDLDVFCINEKLDRGMKIANKRLLVGRILFLSSLIGGIALTILFSPYVAIAIVPLAGYGFYIWSQGVENKKLCLRAQELNAHIEKCYDLIRSLGKLSLAIKEEVEILDLNYEERIKAREKQQAKLEKYQQEDNSQNRLDDSRELEKRVNSLLEQLKVNREDMERGFNAYELNDVDSSGEFANILRKFNQNFIHCQAGYQGIIGSDMFRSNEFLEKSVYFERYNEHLSQLQDNVNAIKNFNHSALDRL